MARIPEAELERLKSEASLVRLIEEAGIALKRQGKAYAACCPFHAEDTASLIVTPAKNLFHCFGCGAAGGPIDWVMKRNGVSFRHAVELLREGLPAMTDATVKRTTVRALPPPVACDADDQALLDQVVGYYHQTLKQSPEALAYLKARGIDHPEAIDGFKLGFANRTLGLRLPDKRRKEGADCAPGWSGWGFIATPATSTSTAVSPCRSSTRRAMCPSFTVARSPTGCGRARPCTSICPARIAACGTLPALPRAMAR